MPKLSNYKQHEKEVWTYQALLSLQSQTLALRKSHAYASQNRLLREQLQQFIGSSVGTNFSLWIKVVKCQLGNFCGCPNCT